jgi:hypothetical protein
MVFAHGRSAALSIVLRVIVAGAAVLGGEGALLPGSAWGAEIRMPAPHPERDFSTYQPTARATRIESGEAPGIDGDLSDPVWSKAQIIDEFYQVDPDAGQPASQVTVARFLYNDNTLFVGIYAYDREPEKIVATVRARDGRLDTDDGVRIYIDPQMTRRDAYYFEMNPLGSRVDALIQNNSTYIQTWNTIWDGAAKRMPDGYSVEMAIPFRDLSFDPSRSDWGLEIQRRVRRTGERIRWSTISAAAYYADVSRAGTLTGISGINQGLGLDIQLYGKSAFVREWGPGGPPDKDSLKFVMSGNAYYKITPGLTGTLTVNPDFSDSPLDLRQVNTTRFVLFQPETRDFFLQDAASFEFGGRGFVRSDAISRDNGRPFFSRNIGLANGRPVSITTGGKLSGQFDGVGIGGLSVLTDGTGTTRNRQVLSAARMTAPVLTESRLGLIVTNGDPSGLSRNSVAGADFQYLNSNLVRGKVLEADIYYQRSFSNTKGDDDAFGGAVYFPNEPWGGDFYFKQLGTNYFPALGFVNRTGVRNYDGRVFYRDRNLGWRYLELSTTWNVFTGLDNRLQSRENIVQAEISTRFTDQFDVRLMNDFEAVPRVFRIADTVPVPVGRYSWSNVGIFVGTSDARPYSARLDVMCCSFYNGKSVRVDLQLDYRPNPLFQFGPHYTFTSVDLPTGSVDIHLFTADFIVNFTPDMQLFTQLQFDNISEKFALSARYRWEYQPGNEIFVSVGQAALIPGGTFTPTFVPQISQAIIRLGHTFRY